MTLGERKLRFFRPVRDWIAEHPRWSWVFAGLLMSVTSWVALWAAGFDTWVSLVIGVPGTLLTVATIAYLGPQLLGGFRDLSDRHVSGSTTERRIFFAAAIVLIIAGTIFGPVNGLVANLHQPGAARFGATVATSPALIPSPHTIQVRTGDAIRTWWAFTLPCSTDDPPAACEPASADPDEAAELPTTTPAPPFPDNADAPIKLAGLLFTIDGFLLVPGYAIVLVVLITWGRRSIADQRANIETTADSVLPDRLMNVSRWAAIMVVVAAVADLIENALASWLLRQAWDAYDPANPDAFTTGSGWFWLLSFLTWAKLAALALALSWVAWFAWTALRHGGVRERQWTQLSGLWRTVLALRVPVIIVASLAVGVLFPSQTSEIFWRWSDTTSHALWGISLTLVLSLALYLVTQWQLIRAEIYDTPEVSQLRKRPADIAWRVWFGVVVVAGAILIVPAIIDATIKPFIGIGMIIALALLGLPLNREPSRAGERQPGLGRGTLPFVLSAGVPVLIAAGALKATAEMLPYQLLRGVGNANWYVLPLASAVLLLLAVAYGLLWSARYGLVRLRRPVRILEDGLLQYIVDSTSRRVPGWLLAFERRSVGWRQPLILLVFSISGWLIVVWMLSEAYRLHGWTAAIGPTAIILLFFLLIACLLSALIELVDWFTPHAPRALALLSFQRMPVMLFLAVWLLVASIRPAGPNEDLYDVPVVSAETSPASQEESDDDLEPRRAESLEAAFNLWRWQNCLVAPDGDGVDPAERPVVPLIMIATSGGGIRAATWTSYVMDRAVGYGQDGVLDCTTGAAATASPAQRLFAASGISGGSVGMATWATRQLQPDPEQDPSTCPADGDDQLTTASGCPADGEGDSEGWIQQELSRDFLSPQLSWFLFVETPWSFVRVGLGQSRADVLDDGWERAWGVDEAPPKLFELRQREQAWQVLWTELAADGLDDEEVAALYDLLDGETERAAQRVPLLIFNGTSAESGCRFNSSVLAGNERPVTDPTTACLQPEDTEQSATTVLPATNDLADYLCPGQDVHLSTAALLSARFPVLSPAGHFEQCAALEGASSETWVVDGGYLEAAGAVTIADLWSALEPMIEEHNSDPSSTAYIVPVVMQIDNGHIEPAGPNETTAPPQFLAPLRGLIGSRNGNNSINRQSVQAIFTRPYIVAYDEAGEPIIWCGARYASFSLLAHPGPRARLGWILSDVGFSDLKDQFRRNTAPVEIVDSWRGDLSGSLSVNQEDGQCPGAVSGG